MDSASIITSLRPTFVIAHASAEEIERLNRIDIHSDWKEFFDGEINWCLQTYLELRDAGFPVHLSNTLEPECVNFIHPIRAAELRLPSRAFVVSLQSDYPAVTWADLHVVQNQSQADLQHSFWIPHWPQPGLIPRDPSRCGVRQVAYSGEWIWLAGRMSAWRSALERDGITLCHLYRDNWNDYSEVDILLAIRSFDGRRFQNRPPSKLFNAWLAGVPLTGGFDSAFEQVGNPGVDYLKVSSFEDALSAIRRFANDPELYVSIVRSGQSASRAFTRSRICEAWVRLLCEPIAEKWRQWVASGCPRAASWRLRRAAWKLERSIKRVVKRPLSHRMRGLIRRRRSISE